VKNGPKIGDTSIGANRGIRGFWMENEEKRR